MTFPFEAKYISVNWADKATVRSIDEASDLIPIEAVGKYEYKLEAVTYSKIDNHLYGQLAFHIPDFGNYYQPAFKDSSGKLTNLIPVENIETGKVWWIEDGKWKKNNKKLYRDSPLCRHIGEALLIFGDISCQIQVHALSFTYDELDLYLSDFRSDLWDLILKEDSYVSADAKTQDIKVATEELIEYINRFIKFVQKILDNPKKELKESQSLQAADKVRPIPRTFMEIATKGYSKLLTGRDYFETYNVVENQYIYAILINISILVDNLSKISGNRKGQYEKNLLDYESRLENFSDEIKIDKEVLENELSDLRREHEKERSKLKKAVSKQDTTKDYSKDERKTLFVKLKNRGKDYYDNEMQFWAYAKIEKEKDWYKLPENDSLNVVFYKKPFDKVIKSGYEYKVTACIKTDKVDKKDKGVIHKRYFEFIDDIKITSTPVETKGKKLVSKKDQLEKTGWKRPLSSEERKEQAKEKEAINRTISLLNTEIENNSDICMFLVPISTKLHKLKKQFSKLKIKKNPHFPGSMTFIQNPNYQGSHKLYKKIMDSSGLDNNLFDSLQETENIGILDIPAVYERWCLLQIIKILIDKFRFTPEKGWKQSLLQQVLTTKKNIILKFKNETTFRNVCLSYEKELSNGKRPDFVLDVTSYYSSGEETKHRFIMDAKFYEEIDISSVVNQLYNQKDYSEQNQNKVFILHPSPKAVPKRKTPQEWSKHNYYGETAMFDWDEEDEEDNKPPNHTYGATLLSPIKRQGATLDDLQRLIGMFLQYGLEKNDGKSFLTEKEKKYNPMVVKKLFCIACGSDQYHYEEKPTPRGKKWWITCKHCYLFTVYSYCGSCHNRLIKNGQYWTYHATQALEPFNIKCPSCGEISMPRD